MADVIKRLWNRLTARVQVLSLEAVCKVRGHLWGKHFSDLFGGAFPREQVWCSRCGKEQL